MESVCAFPPAATLSDHPLCPADCGAADLSSSLCSDGSECGHSECCHQSECAADEQTAKARRFSGSFHNTPKAPEAVDSAPWTSEDSAALYGVPGWGADYFRVEGGHLTVAPEGGACLPAALRLRIPHVAGAGRKFGRQAAALLCSTSPTAAALSARSRAEHGPSLDLFHLTESLAAEGVRTPMMFRFLPIVGHRINKLNVGAAGGGAACGSWADSWACDGCQVAQRAQVRRCPSDRRSANPSGCAHMHAAGRLQVGD